MSCNNFQQFTGLIRNSLKEDIGKIDITTELVISKDKAVKAVLLAKEPCVVCGLGITELAFKTQDAKIKFNPKTKDGDFVNKGKVLALVEGSAKSILTAERVALNFISLLSGVATKARQYAQAVRPYKVKIIDTRKTIPGLRELQKYAVRTGGGYNHRMRLDAMILVKDNHLKAMESVQGLIRHAKKYKLEIEVKNLKEFREALKLKPDIIMLDNMGVKDIKKIVAIKKALSRNVLQRVPELEASGGITLQNIKQIASTGVDMISVGALTHSVKSIDISLEIL
ncbi:MAG: carboxylating nicotinate-nucleotide diphosphorylase [Candidatus Omnitrophica bacterium]|nr:carboxylating nicotinate-nucleotide diphosphorylase [Candidatus Omnitrophota bacterium]